MALMKTLKCKRSKIEPCEIPEINSTQSLKGESISFLCLWKLNNCLEATKCR